MELIQLLGQADRELGRLDMYSDYIPNIDLFISMHVLKEATQSSKIEGTQTNMEEALLEKDDVALDKRDDWEEVQNYVAAMNEAIAKLQTLPFSARLVRERPTRPCCEACAASISSRVNSGAAKTGLAEQPSAVGQIELLIMPGYKIVDTHCHLCDPLFDPDRAEVLERARAAGLSAIITVSENLSDAERNIALAASHPLLRPAAGLYPTHLDINQAEAMASFIRKERSKLFAIGEVGLDYWVVKEESEKKLQREILGRFIDLALELDLPLNVHSRSAGRHAVALLLERGARKVQLHAFDGKAAAALPAVDAGYFFSIPPSVIRSRQKQNLVRRLPLSCLLIETDSPVLAPSPGERNEPANAMLSINAIAELKNVSREEVTETVFNNTLRLFGDLKL